MDEAEILGDRIGIMSQGKLVCLGSTEFLTHRFGTGAKITVDVGDKKALTSFIEQYKQETHQEITVINGEDAQNSKLDIIMPLAETQMQLAPILEQLAKKKEEYKITSTEISETTLEQVFI